MATPKWDPGRLYLPGALVQPRTAPPAVSTAITNPGFESGSTDWTLGAGVSVTSSTRFSGTSSAQFTGTAGPVTVVHASVPVAPGTSITASCMYQQGAADSDRNVGRVLLRWYDVTDTPISPDSLGNIIRSSSNGWQNSTVTAVAPPNAARVAIGCLVVRDRSNTSFVDAFAWNYPTSTSIAGLIYKAVQPAAGLSDSTEPTWPQTVGVQVIDNEVIWEAIVLSRIVWQAVPLLQSGATEPVWPETVGNYVTDGTIKWRTVSRRVEDPLCPNTKEAVILGSKVFAGDNDIVRFCCTANPLDWHSVDDAGFLATGLQQANANNVAVLNQYRGNLVALNASSFQNWQVDPDPALMAILDQMDGIGSTWQQAAQPVANELLYLSQLGVRSVGLAAANNSLSAGDAGMPIDPLVQAAILAAIASGDTPVATYYPSQGQYWLAFPNYPEPDVSTCFVWTMSGGKGKWSRYVFPFAIEAFAQLGDDLFIRNGDAVSRVSEDAVTDDVVIDGAPVAVEFSGTVWWPYLDFGQAGVTKMLEGFDIVGTGTPSLSIGYDQRNLAMFTEPYEIPADTLPGGMIPMPVSAPTMSVRLDFAGGEKWSLQEVILFLSDNRMGV